MAIYTRADMLALGVKHAGELIRLVYHRNKDLDKQDWAAANGYSYPLEEDIEIYYRMVFE